MLRQASEAGQLFGSVSPRDLVTLISDAGFQRQPQSDRAQHADQDDRSAQGAARRCIPRSKPSINVIVARNADEAARIARGEDVTQLRETTEAAKPRVVAAEAFFEPGAGEAARRGRSAKRGRYRRRSPTSADPSQPDYNQSGILSRGTGAPSPGCGSAGAAALVVGRASSGGLGGSIAGALVGGEALPPTAAGCRRRRRAASRVGFGWSERRARRAAGRGRLGRASACRTGLMLRFCLARAALAARGCAGRAPRRSAAFGSGLRLRGLGSAGGFGRSSALAFARRRTGFCAGRSRRRRRQGHRRRAPRPARGSTCNARAETPSASGCSCRSPRPRVRFVAGRAIVGENLGRRLALVDIDLGVRRASAPCRQPARLSARDRTDSEHADLLKSCPA